MELIINGERQQMEALDSLGQVLKALDVPAKRGVAVALNESVVPRGQWDDQPVTDGDRIEIIRATQGG